MWPYEKVLRRREISAVLGRSHSRSDALQVNCDCYTTALARRLAFTHAIQSEGLSEYTWQKILENGHSDEPSLRKEPKYATHGIHSYKGKFYPQLAKALLNISAVAEGSTILDPFCGSGTTLLESHLNGLRSYGCDMHPLAARITHYCPVNDSRAGGN